MGLAYFGIGMLWVVYAGYQENYYLSSVRNIPKEQQDYPLGLVIMISVIMAIHLVILLALSRTYKNYPLSSAVGMFLISLSVAFLVVLGAMHSPPAWSVFALWEAILLAITFVIMVVSFFKKIWSYK